MRGASWLAFVLVAGLLATGRPVAADAAAGPQPPRAQEEFVPVEQLPPSDALPAAPLLVAAYAFAWLAVFGYLWAVWRRLGKLEREIADVARRLDGGGRRD